MPEGLRVLVIGLGKVGFPTAEYMGKFYEVYGYDVKNKIGKNFATVEDPDQAEADVIIICVTTSQVEKVCKSINRNDLTIIESTMQIGSCRRISKRIKFLAYCPHRYWELFPTEYGVKQLRVLGAVNDESLKRAKAFYEEAEIPLHVVSSVEVAEASKIVENSNRFVNIAFSEEVRMLCHEIGLNFDEVREACNTKWNIQLLEARDGIGGVCLPQDISLLSELYSGEGLMNAAVKADEKYKSVKQWLKS